MSRRFLRRDRGSIAVEAAYVMPVVIIGAMMFMELANIGLTIDIGGTALERTLQQYRNQASATLDAADMKSEVVARMVDASHGYLTANNIAAVSVESFNSLDAMGGGSADADDESTSSTQVPVWRVTVDIRKDYITPLPTLLSIESSAFRYRYQQLLGYLPNEDSE